MSVEEWAKGDDEKDSFDSSEWVGMLNGWMHERLKVRRPDRYSLSLHLNVLNSASLPSVLEYSGDILLESTQSHSKPAGRLVCTVPILTWAEQGSPVFRLLFGSLGSMQCLMLRGTFNLTTFR